ncbi:phage NrS-1 polymerase family protein [Atlantibacter hermannii]|uniref:phage NrS-1 polymerase family protein n=1 Tax=Atlantibacter hermannii TaxID=565 RepID=UPI0028979A7A|nr:DUF5906 domain-containing protein [Atlantibacter hermannii]
MTNLASDDGFVKPHNGLVQFIICKTVPSQTKPGRTEKMPCNVAGEVVSLHVAERMTHREAINRATSLGENYRPAVILTGDGRFCIDIDGCLIDGQWSALATELCQTFAGCYVEVSNSGKGLHIFGYSPSIPEHGCKNADLHIECYTDNRFICLGSMGQGDMLYDASGALNATVARYFPATEQVTDAEWRDTHVEGSNPIQDDDALIEKALSSKGGVGAAFGGKATFKDLWTRNVEVLADAYPDPDREYDGSRADAALAQMLAFWCGGNHTRIKRLMERSGLVRDKWTRHRSYMQRTITGACSRQTTYYSVGANLPPMSSGETRTGFQLIAGSNLVDFFKGCVYIIQQHRMMTPNGVMYRPEQFNAAYGGYVFALDADNNKTTRKAFEAFTESQFASLPKVDSLAFRPELPPGEILTEAGMSYVNCYVPTHGERKVGDVTPFLNHMQKLIPDEGDRKILLTWIASCIQNPGKKHQWSPVLVGVDGNGKSLVAQIVKHALGKRWVAEPRSSQIGGRFNSWIENKLFAVIEEVHMNNRRETLDTMKPLITNTTVEVEGKGRDSYDAENRCNILMCTNYKDAVIKTRNDRRYAIIFTGQHSEDDLKRDGMDKAYFTGLFDWLKSGGYAAVADWFDKYTVASCDVMGRAPQTSSTEEAIMESLGGVEQDIIEAVDLERVGFRSGLISSLALDQLLNEKGHRLQTKRKAKVLGDMGYIRHPNLPEGKLKMQGTCLRVYVQSGHMMENAGADVIRERLTSLVDVFDAVK